MHLTPDLTILQVSDLHILPNPDDTLLGINTEHYFHSILEHAFGLGFAFDLILVTGDLAQDPCPASYGRIFKALSAYPVPSICLPGNHDDYALMQHVFNTAQINCRKQALFNDWQLICLNSQIPDSPNGQLSLTELDFLEHCLLTHAGSPTLVAVHHHCLPSGCAWLDTMMIQNSPDLFKLIHKYPQVKAITNGHIHQVMDISLNTLRVLAAPSTCFQFKPNCAEFAVEPTAPGYRIIKLHANHTISTTIYRLAEPLAQLELTNNGY